MEIKNVLIFGLGAIGSIYATKLHDFNPDCISVLLDKSRLQRYKEKGIVFNQKRYDFNYVLDTESSFKADLIIVATKANDFEKTAEKIKNYVGENTVIMSLLNGISSENILERKYGKEKVLYSYFIGHSSMKCAENVRFDGIGKIVFGEADNSSSEKVTAVKNFFDKIGIDYEIPSDMISAMWQKFVVNVGVNQTLAILRMPFEALQTNDYARNYMLGLMQEAVEIAKAEKVNNSEKFIPYVLNFVDGTPSECKPSMLQDIENKKLTEVDIFAGEVVKRGKMCAVPTPFNDAVYSSLKAYNQSVKKG